EHWRDYTAGQYNTSLSIQLILSVNNLLYNFESTLLDYNVSFHASEFLTEGHPACWRNSSAIPSLSDPRTSTSWSASVPISVARSNSMPSARTAIRAWLSAA